MSKHGVEKLHDVQVLYFDVFGTVVDYVETVTKALRREIAAATTASDVHLLQALQQDYDWRHFTIQWREGYKQETKRLAALGNPDKITVDQMHLVALNRLISALPLPATAEAQTVGGFPVRELSSALEQAWSQDVRKRLNFTWHLLEPWPDSVGAMELLKSRFKIGTLTNGNLNLMVDMAKNAKLPWEFLLTADVLGSFKPDPDMYRKSMHLLDIQPETEAHKACMVASHVSLVRFQSHLAIRKAHNSATALLRLCFLTLQLYDLEAAKACGMTTVFVSARPTEDQLPAQGKPDYVDIVVADLSELAHLAL